MTKSENQSVLHFSQKHCNRRFLFRDWPSSVQLWLGLRQDWSGGKALLSFRHCPTELLIWRVQVLAKQAPTTTLEQWSYLLMSLWTLLQILKTLSLWMEMVKRSWHRASINLVWVFVTVTCKLLFTSFRNQGNILELLPLSICNLSCTDMGRAWKMLIWSSAASWVASQGQWFERTGHL